MDIAIVTGASSALGLAVSRRLIQLGFRVYGLGGDYSDCPLQNVNFRPVPCDLADPEAVETAAKAVLEKEKGVCVLIHNAKYFGRNRYGEMSTTEMERILRINLLCPLVLLQTVLESLKALQGHIIQLGTPSSESSRGGPVGAAAAGGLKWMGEALFRDLREHGGKVCHLSPEPNRVRDARTEARSGAKVSATVDPEAIAQAVEQLLQSSFGNVVTEMVIRPLRINEPDLAPVRKLAAPEPKPIPYTVPREFIEAEEELEEEARKKAMQDKRQRRKKKLADKKKQAEEKKTAQPKEEEKPPSGEKEPAKKKRRGRRKPKPPLESVGFVKEEPKETVAKKEPAQKQAQKKAAKKAVKKGAKKQPAKKATKKAAKKAVKRAKTGKQSA